MGMALTGNQNLFKMSNKDAKKEAEKITNFLNNDEKLEILLNKISDIIDKAVFSKKIESGTMRDYIKSEQVSKLLFLEFSKIKKPF